MIRIVVGLIFLMLLPGQQKVPADSLLVDSGTGLAAKAAIYPIKLWQELSYASPHQGCQFEPSCSQYMALSLSRYGVLGGMVVGTDRLLRCNPAALDYHLRQSEPQFTADGRLVEPVPYRAVEHPAANPRVALGLLVIPGLGRVYAGHGFDGLVSFMVVSGLGYISASGFQNGQHVVPTVSAAAALLFWVADFYGAWRSAITLGG